MCYECEVLTRFYELDHALVARDWTQCVIKACRCGSKCRISFANCAQKNLISANNKDSVGQLAKRTNPEMFFTARFFMEMLCTWSGES